MCDIERVQRFLHATSAGGSMLSQIGDDCGIEFNEGSYRRFALGAGDVLKGAQDFEGFMTIMADTMPANVDRGRLREATSAFLSPLHDPEWRKNDWLSDDNGDQEPPSRLVAEWGLAIGKALHRR